MAFMATTKDPVTGQVAVLGSTFFDNPATSTWARILPFKAENIDGSGLPQNINSIPKQTEGSKSYAFGDNRGYLQATYLGKTGFGPVGTQDWELTVNEGNPFF